MADRPQSPHARGAGDALGRETPQKRAIRDVFERAARPLMPEEVLAAARRSVPRMGVATVYRAIRALAEAGELAVVDLPGAPPRWELAGKAHHDHFLCMACRRVFELPGCSVMSAPSLPPGFAVDEHSATFYGNCGACSARAAPQA
jgi:Fur family transcriptional regulator, ferric uptake regulator